MDITAIIGAAVADARRRLNISQTRLAKAIGSGVTTVSALESGECGVSIEMLCKLARALGVEPGSLMPASDDLDDVISVRWVNRLERSTVTRPPRGEKYLAAVAAGVRKYVAEHGHPPRTNGADASAYVGFSTSWTAINSALLKGSNGVMPCGGLRQFTLARGLVLFGSALEQAIENGARMYIKRHGVRPNTRSGDASDYVGVPGTWAQWNRVLLRGRHQTTAMQSLALFLDSRGVAGQPGEGHQSAHLVW